MTFSPVTLEWWEALMFCTVTHLPSLDRSVWSVGWGVVGSVWIILSLAVARVVWKSINCGSHRGEGCHRPPPQCYFPGTVLSYTTIFICMEILCLSLFLRSQVQGQPWVVGFSRGKVTDKTFINRFDEWKVVCYRSQRIDLRFLPAVEDEISMEKSRDHHVEKIQGEGHDPCLWS